MEKYRHERQFRVLYNDCDYRDYLKPAALLTYAQDAAGSSADELGFGYLDLKPHGYAFLSVATCCELYAPAHPSELLTMTTWPITPRRYFFERDYEVRNASGEKIAALSTRWCLYDLNGQKLLTPDALEAHAGCPYRDDRTMQPDFKVDKLYGEGEEVYRMTVRPSHCDHYHHVNNTRYADFFMDCFSSEELGERKVNAFRISYTRQVREGEEIVFYRKNTSAGVLLEARVNGEATTRFFVQFE